jgi:probable rRNA maturation factor
VWEGFIALPFVLEIKVVILEHEHTDIRGHALALFTARARRAIGLRGEVNVCVTSNREMRELNRRFRKKDKPTDVLSFPSVIDAVAGDLAISTDIAAANAAALGHSTETELRILILHGLLHLAGYDHETDSGEMQARELKLRRQLKLPVGLIERAQLPHPARPGASTLRKTKIAAAPRSQRRRS